MILPDDDKKEIKKSLKILYAIALIFLLLIVFSLGYFFRHKLVLKCDQEEEIKTTNVNTEENYEFREVVLFKNFLEMEVEYKDNKIIKIKIEENQDENIVYVQDQKLFTFNSNDYIDSVFIIEDYFILPLVNKDKVTFYIFDEEGKLVGDYSSHNELNFKNYVYKDGKIYISAERENMDNICSLESYTDQLARATFELLYIEDDNFVFRTIGQTKKYISDIISVECK